MSYKWILDLIFIIELVATSSAVRVVPEEAIIPNEQNVLIIGTRDPNGNDHLVRIKFVSVRAKLFRRVEYQETFHTPRNEIITQVRVQANPMMHASGTRTTLIDNGPGFQNVTLNFISKKNSRIEQVVMLYGYINTN